MIVAMYILDSIAPCNIYLNSLHKHELKLEKRAEVYISGAMLPLPFR